MNFVLVSREKIWGGGEVFLRDLGMALDSLGFSCIFRVYQDSALSSDKNNLEKRKALSFTRNSVIVANDFRSLWQSFFLDRLSRRVFIIHGPWQISAVRAAICRLFAVKVYVVNNELIDVCSKLGLQGVTLMPLGPVRELRPIIRPLPEPTSELIFGMVARLDPIKRHRLFTEVVDLAGARGVIVCPPAENFTQNELLKDAESDKVEIFSDGNADRVWQSCNMYLCSSKYESLGLAILESLNHGIPVICLAEGGPRQLLTNALKLGFLPGAIPSYESLESAVRSIRENWDQYWIDAQNLISTRGPMACAQVILEGLDAQH
jgi:glycosyltransferase involved in cell wall biosynthesis